MDGSGWQGIQPPRQGRIQRQRRPEPHPSSRTMSPRRSRPRRTGRAGRPRRPLLRRSRHHRGRHPRQVAALVYIAAFAPDKGESVNTLIADPPPGARAADPAAAGRLPVARPGEVPRLVRRRPERREGRRSWPTRRCPGVSERWRIDHGAGVAGQAELVPRGHRGPDDPTARAAGHVRARRVHRHRSQRQPRDLRVPARRRRRPYRASRVHGDTTPPSTHIKGRGRHSFSTR